MISVGCPFKRKIEKGDESRPPFHSRRLSEERRPSKQNSDEPIETSGLLRVGTTSVSRDGVLRGSGSLPVPASGGIRALSRYGFEHIECQGTVDAAPAQSYSHIWLAKLSQPSPVHS